MSKHSPAQHGTFQPRDLLAPILTLGFYGLRRFRPRALYNATALLVLAVWIGLTFLVGWLHEGAGYLMLPILFAMVAVTFFRLLPAASHRAGSHR